MSCNSRVALNIYHKYRFITNKFKLSWLGVGMLQRIKAWRLGTAMTTGTAHALVSLVLPAWLDWLKTTCYSTIVLIKHFVKPPLLTPCYHLACSVQHACIVSLLMCLSWTCHSKMSLQSWWHRVSGATNTERLMAAPTILIWGQLPSWPLTARMPVYDYQLHKDWASEILRQILVCYGCAKSFGAGEKQIENW